MTATPTMIRELRDQRRLTIDKDLEALILGTYRTEPHPYTYTEQDLHEQIRKLIVKYNRDHGTISSHEAIAAFCGSTQPLPTNSTRSTDEEPGGGCL